VRSAALAVTALASLAACRKGGLPLLERPRQTVEGFSLSQSNKGQPLWDLHAPHAELREDDHESDLELPKLQIYKNGKLASTLTAETGVVDMRTYDVTMSSRVLATSLDDGSTLSTEELKYDGKNGKFRTDKDVLVKKPGGVMRGKGLEANKDLSEIRVFKQSSVFDKAPR